MGARIGVSLGDPNGIGPEITLKAIEVLTHQNPELHLIPIGDPDVVIDMANRLNVDMPAEILASESRFPEIRFGAVTPLAGKSSADWVEEGIQACIDGEVDALVTAPICKEAWILAHVDYPGHTELLARRCNTDRFGMLLAGRGLRVMLATRHVAVRRIVDVLTPEAIRMAVDLLVEGLPMLGCPEPRIALCGLNPHAGDGGTIGTEEVDWMASLIQDMKNEGKPVSGPHPGDTVFHDAVQGAYDAVVAMYHDQGLAPLKLWAFDSGVNLTLGLPIIRTSPDHGTAFDIAGKGIARPDSMIEAVKTAAHMASQPNPWTRPAST